MFKYIKTNQQAKQQFKDFFGIILSLQLLFKKSHLVSHPSGEGEVM